MTDNDVSSGVLRILDEHSQMLGKLNQHMESVVKSQSEVASSVDSISKALTDHITKHDIEKAAPISASISSFMAKAWSDPLIKVVLMLLLIWLFGWDFTGVKKVGVS